MTIHGTCPECENPFSAPDEAKGRLGACPKCGHKFPLSESGSEQTSGQAFREDRFAAQRRLQQQVAIGAGFALVVLGLIALGLGGGRQDKAPPAEPTGAFPSLRPTVEEVEAFIVREETKGVPGVTVEMRERLRVWARPLARDALKVHALAESWPVHLLRRDIPSAFVEGILEDEKKKADFLAYALVDYVERNKQVYRLSLARSEPGLTGLPTQESVEEAYLITWMGLLRPEIK